jgi:hypothetical protein
MRTVSELRQAMVEATADLVAPVTLAGVRAKARQRTSRYTGAGAAILVLALLATVFTMVARPGGLAGTPSPTPSDLGPSVSAYPEPSASAGPEPSASPAPGPHDGTQLPPGSIQVHPSFMPSGNVIDTQVRVGADEELVVYFTEGPGRPQLISGLHNRMTGAFRTLYDAYPWLSEPRGFTLLYEVDSVVDYGVYIGPVSRIVVDIGGARVPAQLARWSVDPSYVVFWVDRRRVPPPGPTGIVFSALDKAGKVLATSAGRWPGQVRAP